MSTWDWFWTSVSVVIWITALGIHDKREKKARKEYYEFGWYKASNAYMSSINHPEFAERIEAYRLGYGPLPLPTIKPPDFDTVEAELKEKYG